MAFKCGPSRRRTWSGPRPTPPTQRPGAGRSRRPRRRSLAAIGVVDEQYVRSVVATIACVAGGIYCEDLPCPCLKPGHGSDGSGGNPGSAPTKGSCARPKGVQPISFSATRYPHIKQHTERAIGRGWPRVLVVNRSGDDARRDRLLAHHRGGMTATSTRPPSDAAAEPDSRAEAT